MIMKSSPDHTIPYNYMYLLFNINQVSYYGTVVVMDTLLPGNVASP
mgnify:FL=1